MKALHIITWILLVIGGLNWLLIGLGGWNLVDMAFGMGSMLSKIVYLLVGLSTLVEIFTHKKNCTCCSKSGATSPTM